MLDTHRVLVVDDEPSVCKSAHKILTKKGYYVGTARSGEEALRKTQDEMFDAVITDLKMPGISGMEVIRHLKAEQPRVVIVAITGYATVENAVEAMRLGAIDFVAKPFTPSELASTLERSLKRKLPGFTHRVSPESTVPVVEEILPLLAPEIRPADLPGKKKVYVTSHHTWVSLDKDGLATIGVDESLKGSAADVIYVDLPFEDDEVELGQVCIKMTTSDRRIIRVASPISGKVVAINEFLNIKSDLLRSDPMGDGWLIRIAPASLEAEMPGLSERAASS